VRLLVTRPQPDGERTAAALRARGHEPLVAALMRIETVAGIAIGEGPWSAVIVTSTNALRAIETHPRRAALTRLPLFAVGARTAAAARAAGFAEIAAAGRDADDLLRRIGGWTEHGGVPLLYLAGEETSRDLAEPLAKQGLRVETIVAYRAVKARRMPPDVGAALAAAALDGVLHFSRRSAEAYIDCARGSGLLDHALAPRHYCLSRQVAGPLEAAGAGHVLIAPRPEEAALLDLIDGNL
jgi:uroporphyrinogen-III synthase